MGSTLGGTLVSVSQLSSYRSNLRHGHQASGGESLPSDVGECMQREVQALAGLKRRLRDDDARSMVVREHVADALTALSQQRLASAVEALVRGTAGAREVPMFQVVRYAAARGVENMFRRGRSQRAAGSREARSRGAALSGGLSCLGSWPYFVPYTHTPSGMYRASEKYYKKTLCTYNPRRREPRSSWVGFKKAYPGGRRGERPPRGVKQQWL